MVFNKLSSVLLLLSVVYSVNSLIPVNTLEDDEYTFKLVNCVIGESDRTIININQTCHVQGNSMIYFSGTIDVMQKVNLSNTMAIFEYYVVDELFKLQSIRNITAPICNVYKQQLEIYKETDWLGSAAGCGILEMGTHYVVNKKLRKSLLMNIHSFKAGIYKVKVKISFANNKPFYNADFTFSSEIKREICDFNDVISII